MLAVEQAGHPSRLGEHGRDRDWWSRRWSVGASQAVNEQALRESGPGYERLFGPVRPLVRKPAHSGQICWFWLLQAIDLTCQMRRPMDWS